MIAIPARRLLALLAVLGTGGCVSPHLDGLATAECASAADCTDDQVCREGTCQVPVVDRDGPPLPDLGLDAVVDAGPDVSLDATPDAVVDMQLDMGVDGPPDMIPDGPPDGYVDGPADMMPDVSPDMAPDMTPDMEVDAACVPAEEVCNGLDDDCDGAVDEAPETLCPAIAGTVLLCEAAACVVSGCEPGFVDVDEEPLNGCECVAFPGFDSRDLPEPAGLDADCDGVPGEAPVAIFVSREAGVIGGDGSAGSPLTTLDDALALARDMPAAAVVLDAGAYRMGQRLVVDGGRALVLVGGFVYGDGGWRRVDGAAPIVEIDGGAFSPTIDVDDGWLALDGIRLLAAGTPAPVGIRGAGCQQIELVRSEIDVGGPVGRQALEEHGGRSGAPGADAESTARAGAEGSADGSEAAGGDNPGCPAAAGGAGGVSLAGVPAGDDGDPAADGVALGGRGADANTAAVDGSRGLDGADGAPGRSASPAGRWSQGQRTWLRATGRDPLVGQPGGGGGGGGGGLGDAAGSGGSGGGGAAGGCPGRPGSNGTGGFGSFGVVIVGGCGLLVEDSEIIVPAGGVGGAGAAGGAGAPGALGGRAGVAPNGIQPAGDGGDGGDGGCGGDGAGGPGGPSIGILRIGENPTPVLRGEGVTIRIGAGGLGGAASSNPECPRPEEERPSDGADGIALEIACCPEGGGSCGDLRCADLE